MSGDTSDVFPNPAFDFRDNPWFAVFRAKGEVVMQ
jgi:hypothetical protein